MIIISVICSFLVALGCILVYHFLLRRDIKDENAAEESKVDCIVDSMPALYYLEEMVMDDNGNVVDLKIHKMNKRCFDYYDEKNHPLGKYSSEIFQQLLGGDKGHLLLYLGMHQFDQTTWRPRYLSIL